MSYFKKSKKEIMWHFIIIFFGTFCVMKSCSYINDKVHLEDDNHAEEVMEEVFKYETGIAMDFTPSSKE